MRLPKTRTVHLVEGLMMFRAAPLVRTACGMQPYLKRHLFGRGWVKRRRALRTTYAREDVTCAKCRRE